jgi:hypothetical protein
LMFIPIILLLSSEITASALSINKHNLCAG